jgi:signal peptidase I
MKIKSSKFLILVFFLLLNGGCVKPVRVEGTAMNPTLSNGDRILLNTNIGEPERGAIISFLYPKDKSKWYLKRIIGLPGETLEIRDGKVFINAELLDEPYISNEFNTHKSNSPPQIIGKNQYFVMGDNRDNSSDSRYWGNVPKELIVGKYYLTY